ncbi:unnamed protein product, partial [Rotaria sp. Silwood2]
PAGHHQQLRRPDEADLGRAGGRDPARHQARRAQDQYRHRQPHGDDRPDPQDPVREPQRIRSAQISEAGDGSDDQALQAAPAGIQHGRPGQQGEA